MKNSVNIKFDGLSVNEAFARVAVASFIAPLNPTIEELADIKTAVSEGVTNAIVHGYRNCGGLIEMKVSTSDRLVRIEIIDDGLGIDNVEEAMKPFFTTCSDGTRSGMGFTVMENFMDEIQVASAPDEGTRLIMKKRLRAKE